MRFLLCHQCLSWVKPQGGHCPDCHGWVDSTVPDPSLQELSARLGRLLFKIGAVRVRHKLLPQHGLLYATTTGLFFVPHRVEQVTEIDQGHDSGTRILWSLAASFWLPLYLFMPLIKLTRPKAKQVTVYRPQLLTPAESGLLGEFLMDNPGAFFIPSQSVCFVQRKRRWWVIDCVQRCSLSFKPASLPTNVDRNMTKLIDSPGWQHVMT